MWIYIHSQYELYAVQCDFPPPGGVRLHLCACVARFFRASELDIHRRRQHTLQLRLQCSVCDHRSEEKRKLLNHENAAHQMHRSASDASGSG